MPRPEWLTFRWPKRAKPPERAPIVAEAKRALQAFWGTPGMQGAAEAALACRRLTVAELELVGAWVPRGSNSTVGRRVEKAREIVEGVIAEKEADDA